jgi:hypothetical protein
MTLLAGFLPCSVGSSCNCSRTARRRERLQSLRKLGTYLADAALLPPPARPCSTAIPAQRPITRVPVEGGNTLDRKKTLAKLTNAELAQLRLVLQVCNFAQQTMPLFLLDRLELPLCSRRQLARRLVLAFQLLPVTQIDGKGGGSIADMRMRCTGRLRQAHRALYQGLRHVSYSRQ